MKNPLSLASDDEHRIYDEIASESRISYDGEAEAIYVALEPYPDKPVARTISRRAMVNYDYIDDKLVGIEILDGGPEEWS